MKKNWFLGLLSIGVDSSPVLRLGDKHFNPYITTGVGILLTSASVTVATGYASPSWSSTPPQ